MTQQARQGVAPHDWAAGARLETSRLESELSGWPGGAGPDGGEEEATFSFLEAEASRREAEARAEIESLSEAVSDLEGQLARGHDREEKLASSLRSARTELRQLQEELQLARAEIGGLKGSGLFRTASYYRRGVEKAAPPGTRRRSLYSHGRQAVGRLVLSRGSGPAEPFEAAEPKIVLRTSAEPDVSVIVPVHGKWRHTADCLSSIGRHVSSYAYQVIVVDDASPDDTAEHLREVEGLDVVSLPENRGFVHAVNAGIKAASGRYVVLLNNDTVVQPGWLDALVDTVELDPSVGVVGSKLVYPDGSLQEAGGIIFSDGSGWNFGRGADPGDPAFNYCREVDYCSGASLLVRQELLQTLGGLDTRFAPAYYEDTDLCFAARELGYKVLYQPNSVVIHAEGVSHGTDINTGGKAGQARNRVVFCEKWQERLEEQYDPDPAIVRIASRRPGTPRGIIMDWQVPTPNQDSGSRRMYEFMRLLSASGLGLTFIPIVRPPAHEPYVGVLQEHGIEVERPDSLPDVLGELSSALEFVMLVRPAVADPHLPVVREIAPGARVVYDTVDLHFVRERRRAEIEKDEKVAAEAEVHYETELGLARSCDATLVVSPVEQEILLGEEPNLFVRVVPNIHADQHPGRPFAQRRGLLFVGSFPHPPNRDAAKWFVEEILPLVNERLPGVPVNIVGSQPTEEIMALGGENVNVLGWVPDLSHLYQTSRVFIAPLRYGAGMKGKVGESLSYGLPVVTTRIGAEGMGLRHGHDVLIGDDAESFADAVLRIYEDGELWRAVAAAGRRTISERYSPAAVKPVVAELLRELKIFPDEPARR